MVQLKFPKDNIVNRMRWILVGTIVCCFINTLIGQSTKYWHNPETAIRADGLSIYNPTNHAFDFFIGYGWFTYIVTCVVYLTVVFLLVSLLPKRLALITIFSFIFGYFFVVTNWIAIRWHLGMIAVPLFAIVLSPFIVFNLFTKINISTNKILIKLGLVMIGLIFLDCANTLIGQPDSYWIHPDTVHEGNQISRFFLNIGWYYFVLYDLVYSGILFLLVFFIPKRMALILIFCFILIHFAGASCWYYFEWRIGIQSFVILGIILSIIIVLVYESETSKSYSLTNKF